MQRGVAGEALGGAAQGLDPFEAACGGVYFFPLIHGHDFLIHAQFVVAVALADFLHFRHELFGARLDTIYSTVESIEEQVISADLVIGAVLVPGAAAPKLVTRDMIKRMRRGSVLVDVAIDQGGCAETSRPTTHHDPVYVEEGVTHYCVANMPGAYARTATQALTNATFRYLQELADHGLAEACHRNPALFGGVNVMGGHVTSRPVAEAHGLPWVDPKTLIG